MATRAGEDSESSDDDVSAPSVGAGAASGGDEALGAALLEALEPPLSSLSGRLVELQEAQRMLVTTMTVQRAELTEGNSDWLAAKLVLDRIPGVCTRCAFGALQMVLPKGTARASRAGWLARGAPDGLGVRFSSSPAHESGTRCPSWGLGMSRRVCAAPMQPNQQQPLLNRRGWQAPALGRCSRVRSDFSVV